MFGLGGRQIFLLLLLVFTLYAGSQFVPAYFHAFQFNDFIKQEVKFALSARRTPEDIRDHIVQQAKEFEIPVQPRDVQIAKRGPAFTVEFDYNIPIDLRVYKRDLTFHVSETGELFEK
jgi:hypothetical protein